MIYKPIIWLLCLSLTLATCRKKEVAPIDQLPAETQMGAGTFGCLVNGEAFTPKGSSFGPPYLTCTYQIIWDNQSRANKGWSFQLYGSKKESNQNTGIGIFTDSLELQEGKKYKLFSKNKRGFTYGRYDIASLITGTNIYLTNETIYTGELWVKKYDRNNYIVAGTFWFDAVDNQGNKVEVRAGRFDMHYSQ